MLWMTEEAASSDFLTMREAEEKALSRLERSP